LQLAETEEEILGTNVYVLEMPQIHRFYVVNFILLILIKLEKINQF
jgi:hemolysin-activating ACP:hemolysin acyltransferase